MGGCVQVICKYNIILYKEHSQIFGFCRGPWNQAATDTKGWLYNSIFSDFKTNTFTVKKFKKYSSFKQYIFLRSCYKQPLGMQYQTKIDIVSFSWSLELNIKHTEEMSFTYSFNRYLLSIRSYNHVKIACNASTQSSLLNFSQ